MKLSRPAKPACVTIFWLLSLTWVGCAYGEVDEENSTRPIGFPGGIVTISVEKTSNVPPDVRFGLTEVAVVDAGNHWQALIGLGLDQLPGEYIVYTRQANSDEPAQFVAFEVLHRDYQLAINRQQISENEFPSLNSVIAPELETFSILNFNNSQPPSLPFNLPISAQWRDVFGAQLSNPSSNREVRLNYIVTAAPIRSLVRAPQNAIVSTVLETQPEIYTVVLDHGQNVYSVLSGLTDLAVEVGNGVQANAIIAKVPDAEFFKEIGSGTRNSAKTDTQPTNPVTWQLNLNGEYVNPLLLTKTEN